MNMFNALWCTLSSALLLLLLECIFKSQLESLSRFCWSLRVSRSYQSSFGSDLRKEVPLRPYYFSPPFALQLDFNHKCVYLKGKNKKDRLIGKLTQGSKNSNKQSCTTRRRKAKLLLSCNCFLSVSRVAVGGAIFLDHCHDVTINEVILWSFIAYEHLRQKYTLESLRNNFCFVFVLICQSSFHSTADF